MNNLDYKFFITILFGYGLFLLFLYQLGFFSIIGFEFAALVVGNDLWFGANIVVPYFAAISAAIIVILAIVQSSEQAGLDIAAWVEARETAIAIVFGAFAFLILVLAVITKNIDIMMVLVCIYVLYLFVSLYCRTLIHKKINVWSLGLLVLGSQALSFSLGMYAAYRDIVKKQTFNIELTTSKIENVRLVRASGAGLIYYRKPKFYFVNLSKVVSISPRDATP